MINRQQANPKTFSVIDAIGNTPLLQVEGIYAKLESVNPSGSIKDRAALEIIETAEREGKIKPGDTIVEASSGNMGISLAMIAAVKGYKIIVVMPENMSEERKQMMSALGAELVLTSAKGRLSESAVKAEEIGRRPNTFLSRQFSNPANIRAQEKLGEEILAELGPTQAVVAGVGTGGTLMGIASVMRKANPNVKVIAVEPEEAAVMFKGENIVVKSHRIQGIGDGFIPALVDMRWVDEAIAVTSEEACEMARKLARDYGLLVGISSGANVVAAIRASQKHGKTVTVLPDRGERYLSMGLFRCP
jgi:cysteine synthase A